MEHIEIRYKLKKKRMKQFQFQIKLFDRKIHNEDQKLVGQYAATKSNTV